MLKHFVVALVVFENVDATVLVPVVDVRLDILALDVLAGGMLVETPNSGGVLRWCGAGPFAKLLCRGG